MKGVVILGSTGSIGMSTLDVIARHADEYHVTALAAHRQVARMVEQCQQYQPDYAVMADTNAAEQLQQQLQKLGCSTNVLAGEEGLVQIASLPQVDYVMAAIVGASGLQSTLAAARSGKRVLLANKESLVMSGPLFMQAVKQNNAELLPIDSEHNAIFQCMPFAYKQGLKEVGVKRILLTGSGGPFRTRPIEKLVSVSPDEACAHPNWNMGRKISVDSATMMNKGLELIEACWLFDTTPDQVQILLHPQSVIHSMVEYVDGSILAQMGQPDMRIPIAHAMAWPERMESGVESLDLFQVARLEFQQVDLQRFPCLYLAEQAMRQGGTAPAILNAANEVAVQAFLDNELIFTSIAEVVEEVLSNVDKHDASSLDIILADDAAARQYAQQCIKAKQKQVS